MATNSWIGAAQTIPEVRTYTPGATIAAGNTFTLTCNSLTITYTAITGDTVALVCAGLLNILAGNVASQPVPAYFTKITWSGVGTVGAFTAIQGIGESDGRPFTITSSAAGGSASLTAATTQAAVSPSDVGLAANWSLGVPVNGQDILITGANGTLPGLLYNLTALAAVTPNTFTSIDNNFQIGLPYLRQAGYIEYLPLSLQLAAVTNGMTINNTSRLMNFDLLAGTCVASILNTGNGPNNAPAALNFINGPTTLDAYGGSVAVAMLAGTSGTISGNINVEGGCDLQLGTGTTVSGTTTVSGKASLESYCNLGTVVINGATWTHFQGTVANPTLQNGGKLTYMSTGAISGTLILGPNGCAVDFSQNPTGPTIAHCTMFLGSSFLDPYRVCTLSNPILLTQCGIENVTILRGKNINVTV